MEPGDVIRQRNVRSYGVDPRNYVEFVPDKAKDHKKMFVMLYLGTEHFQICDKKGNQVMAQLDVEQRLQYLGFWSEKFIEEALGPKAGPKAVQKLCALATKKVEETREAAAQKKLSKAAVKAGGK